MVSRIKYQVEYQFIWTVITALTYALPVQAQIWRPTGSNILNGISGMAIIEQDGSTTSFLIVHDNKNDDEQRAAWLTINGAEQPLYTPLAWPQDSLPIDLEALTTIPGQPNQFLALSSAGEVYHIRLTDSQQSIEVLNTFDLPDIPDNSNFEGLAVQQVNNILIVAWAHRGNNEQPAILYWTTLDLASYAFSTPVRSVPLTMPWPLNNVRHVSDLKIDSSGAVFVTSASDAGNDGPFASAFYLAGTFQTNVGNPVFLPSKTPVPLLRFNYHKIEAFELMPGRNGGLVFGTDDENFGSSLYLTW